jgi:4-aminobutyrate aminotransferase-like enzyme
VLVEPVLSDAGNLLPRRRFLAALRDLCHQRGWLLVFDESLAGFGRTGALFAFESFGVEPDIVVLGQGLGSGLPLSAVCAGRALWDESASHKPAEIVGDRSGNPLAYAAGTAALEIVTESGFLEQVQSVGAHAARRLREVATASPRIARPRGIGLMLGFDLVDPDNGTPASAAECEALVRACRERGALIAATSPRVRLAPPLMLSPEEADRLFDVIAEVTT